MRPGAMTRAMRAASPQPREGTRALRWALVKDGRIVREAIVLSDRALTIGAGADVPWGGSRERALAWCDEGRWRLCVSAAWSGRLGDRSLAEHVATLRSEDGWFEIELGEESRGRLVIGEHALLLQVIDAPARRRPMPLPAALTGGLFKQADWMFTAFMAASFLLHFAFVVGLIEADWPVETALIPSRDAEIIFAAIEEPEPSRVPEEEMRADADEPAEESATPESETSTPSPSTPRPRSTQPRPRPSAEGDAIARDAARQAANILIAGLRPNERGAMIDLMENGAPTGDSADILEQASSTTVASNRPGMVDERRGSSGPAGDGDRSLGRLAASGGGRGPVEEGRPVEEVRIVVQPSPILDPIDPLPPGFDPRELIRALRARMPAVQRCYEHELTRGNPDTEGRLVMSITVMPVGSVANLHAAENETGSDALAACTVRSLRNTRVRVGPSEPVEVRYPIVFRRPG